ncbi:MAG: type II secretion system F family protein [bacterium]|nr:type II secretion system F family protein [bacterium]
MSIFSFNAKDPLGKSLKGIVEARDQKEALVLLHQRQLLIISLKIKGEDPVAKLTHKLRRVGFGDIVNFTRQLATMFTAGLRLSESLRILERQTENPALRSVIVALRTDVESGTSFAQSLEKHSCFSAVYIAVVRAGEASGKLDQILAQMADNLEKQRALRSKIIGALIYPAVILLAMFVVMAVLMIMVIPGLVSVYEAFEADLPVATKLLIATSKFMSQFWWLTGLGMFGGIVLLRVWHKTAFGRRESDIIILKIPILGKLAQKTVLTEFCRTLGLLSSAGVPLIDGLNIVSGAAGNVIYQELIRDAARQVEKGFALSAVLEGNSLFPAIVVQMTRVGEETGKIDETLMRVSTYFEMETDQLVKSLTVMIEPLIMVVLGVGVGFMVYSIIVPIYNLVGNFK